MRIFALIVLALSLSACVTDGYYEDGYYSSSGYNGVYSDDYYEYDRHYGYPAYSAFDVRNRYDPYWSLFWGWDYYAYSPYRSGYFAYGLDPFYNPYYGWNGFSYGYGWPYTSFAWGWPSHYGYWRPYRHHHDHGERARERGRDAAYGLRDHGLPAPYVGNRGRQGVGAYGYDQRRSGSYTRGIPRSDANVSRNSARELSRDLGNRGEPQRSRYDSGQREINTRFQRERSSAVPRPSAAPTQPRSSGYRSFDRPLSAPPASSSRSAFGGSGNRPVTAPSSNRRSLPSSPARAPSPVRNTTSSPARPSAPASNNSGRGVGRGNREKD